MSYTLRVEQFEGPLELLLKLIEDEQLDITAISLSKVTDQFLEFVRHEEALPPDEVADFLVVAAKLIYIKSKHLLPALELDEEEGDDLEEQLKIYREYYEASKVIHQMIGRKRFSYARAVPLKIAREVGFSPPPRLTREEMSRAFFAVIKRLDAIIKLPKIVLKSTVSIREKINALKDAVARGIMKFHEIYDTSNKQDAIVSFLALLELVKARHVTAEQHGLFSDIVISKG